MRRVGEGVVNKIPPINRVIFIFKKAFVFISYFILSTEI